MRCAFVFCILFWVLVYRVAFGQDARLPGDYHLGFENGRLYQARLCNMPIKDAEIIAENQRLKQVYLELKAKKEKTGD